MGVQLNLTRNNLENQISQHLRKIKEDTYSSPHPTISKKAISISKRIASQPFRPIKTTMLSNSNELFQQLKEIQIKVVKSTDYKEKSI